MKTLLLKLIVLTGLLLNNERADAQNLKSTYNLSIEQIEAGNYSAAITHLERVIFFDTSENYAVKAYVKKAICHVKMGEVNKAFRAYDKAISIEKNDSVKNEIALEKSFYLLQNKYWNKAINELYSIEPKGISQQELLNYYLGTALFATSDFEQSKKYFFTLCSKKTDSLQLASIFNKAEKKLNPKRAKWARNISFIIPGSGQFAAGNIKSGLNSILLLAGLTALYVNTNNNYGVFSGMITVLPWLSRYHIGGAENAEESMLTRQEKIMSRYFNEIIYIVLHKN